LFCNENLPAFAADSLANDVWLDDSWLMGLGKRFIAFDLIIE